MSVLSCADIGIDALQTLLNDYRLDIVTVADDQPIPGSWFGDSEAGLIGQQLFVRGDTPLHSALHESCHFICMDPQRRQSLHTNAGGDYDEENAVCYLQILLADHIENFGRDRMFKDMDQWGYTFRLGSSKAWFKEDAQDARQWLQEHGLINNSDQPQWTLRQ